MNDFVIHACEQVLRFTSVDSWNDLTEERKVQLSFNMGVVALGLNLTKEEGYDYVAGACSGAVLIKEVHEHIKAILESRSIEVSEKNVLKEV